MPNRYPDPNKAAAAGVIAEVDSMLSSTVTQTATQSWSTAGGEGGSQVKMYSLQDFGQQQVQPPSDVSATMTNHVNWMQPNATVPSSESDDWSWSNNGQPDPWAWGTPSTGPGTNTVSAQPMWSGHMSQSAGNHFNATLNQDGELIPPSSAQQQNSTLPSISGPYNSSVMALPNQMTPYQTTWNTQPYNAVPGWDTGQQQVWTGDGYYQWYPEAEVPAAEPGVSVMENSQPSLTPGHSASGIGMVQPDQPAPEHPLAIPTTEVSATHSQDVDNLVVRSNVGADSSRTIETATSLAGHAPHLFQRSDSWLSSSSLQTFHDSLSGSQDMLDASHFMPAETVEVVRQHMAELALKENEQEVALQQNSKPVEAPVQSQGESVGVRDADANRTNQEVVEESSDAVADVSDALENQEETPVKVPPTVSQLKEDDRVRQPPDGAATRSPIVTVSAFQPPIAGTAITRQPMGKQDGGLPTPADVANQNAVEDASLNVEAPSITAAKVPVESSNNNPVVSDSYVHHVNIYASLIGPREGSPFKPPVKNTASIPAIIQQEVSDATAMQTGNVAAVIGNQEYDNGANLEMTPDNAEHPPTDLEPACQGVVEDSGRKVVVSPNEEATKPNDVVTIPASTALWNNPEPKQANIFLAPAASNAVQQNVLIVPPLTEQLLDTSMLSPAGSNTQTENVEDVSKIFDKKLSPKPPTTTASVDQPPSQPIVNVQNASIPLSADQVPYQSTVPAEFRQEMTSKNTSTAPERQNLLASGDNVTSQIQSQSLLLERPAAGDQQRLLPPGGNRGQRPPVPGLGPVQPLRSTSEPPSSFGPNGNPVGREERDRDEERINRERDDDIRQGERDERGRMPRVVRPGDDRDPYYDYRNNDERNWRDGYRPSSRGREEDRLDYRNRHGEEFPRNYDDPYYHYQERDRSRPSSRQSMDERDYRYRDEHDQYSRDNGGRAPPGPPNRDQYERDPYRPPREQDPYKERDRGRPPRGYDDRFDRPPSRGGYDSDRENGQDRYYNRRPSVDERREKDEYQRRDPRYYVRGEQHEKGTDPGYYDRYYRQYYNQYPYGYNNFNFGYYDELYRNDPRYRAQYNTRLQQYYAAYYAAYDNSSDQRSVQSGRSSVNDEIQHEREKHADDFRNSGLDGGNRSYMDQSTVYPAAYDQTNSTYYNSEQYPTAVEEPPKPAARLTPTKFSMPHVRVQFTTGGHLIKLLPNNPAEGQPGVVEIHELQAVLGESLRVSELKNFPGPLVKGETHKNDVIQFCMERIKSSERNISLSDKTSYILIWELLILLVRQNGTVVGTDIAELLLKDHNLNTPRENDSSAEITPDGNSNAEVITPDEGISVTSDRSVISRFSEETVTHKFREYLLFGRKKEALEKAMKNGLWGHALFLASKMDNRTYASVMTRFANSLALNDPLQTLYQTMSGRQPASVTCIVEEKWGDWRPHLAMILSNPTQRPDLDRKSVTTMGDTLAARGLLHASQFCYLMAQMDFGSYLNKSSKLVLIGANHSLPFGEFATNEAIHCTEVYEYAQQLANSNFILPSFQTYRFIYATRLAEAGMPQECLHYCEVIGNAVCKMPALFHPAMVGQVLELANKLKFHHHHYTNMDGEVSDMSDPDWLLQLKNVLQAYNTGMIQPVAEDNGYPYLSGSSSNVTGSENGDVTSAGVHPATAAPDATVYDSTAIATGNLNQTPSDQSYAGYQYQQGNYTGYATQAQPQDCDPTQFTYSGGRTSTPNLYNDVLSDAGGYYQQNYQNFQANYQPNAADEIPANQYSSPIVGSMTSTMDAGNISLDETKATGGSGGEYSDYWDQTTKKTTTSKPIDQTPVPSNKSVSKTQEKSNSKKKDVKAKPAASGSGSSWLGGIFSKFLPKAPNQMKLPDDCNPTIVWDPVTSSWVNTDNDEEETTNSPAAPPRDSEILGRKSSLPKNNSVPNNNPSSVDMSNQSAGPPSGDYNKFRRLGTGKGLGSHQRYVDVVAKSTSVAAASPMPSHLLPGMETSSTNQHTPQLFVPSAVSTNSQGSGDNSMEYMPYGNQPQVGNPGSRSGSPTHNEDTEEMLSRSSSQGSLAREVQRYMAPNLSQQEQLEPPAQQQQQQQVTDAPPQLPMMFNPSLLAQQPTAFATNTTAQRPPNRLSQYGRRYPR